MVNDTSSDDAIRSKSAAISYRTAVIPFAVYVGAAIKNSATILTELAPWGYLGISVALVAVSQAMQRRKGVAWPWSVSLTVGFCIAAIAMLGSMAIASIVSQSQVTPAR